MDIYPIPEHEHIPGFSRHDEEIAEYVTDCFDHRKTVALCDEFVRDLYYFDTPHSRLLDITKAAQLDCPIPTFSLSASAEEYPQDDSTSSFRFAAKGFSGDMPFTLSLNANSSFSFCYSSFDRKGYLDKQSADTYRLDQQLDNVPLPEVITFLYALLHEQAIGETDDTRHLTLMKTLINSADMSSLQPILAQIGCSFGLLVEQHGKSIIYPDSADRALDAELTIIEYPDVTERILKTSSTYFTPRVLGSIAHTITTQKRVNSLNVGPVEGALESNKQNIEVSLSVDGNPQGAMPLTAIQSTVDSLDYLMTNAIIVERL